MKRSERVLVIALGLGAASTTAMGAVAAPEQAAEPSTLPPPPPRPLGTEPPPGTEHPAGSEPMPPAVAPSPAATKSEPIHDGFFARASLGLAWLVWRGSTTNDAPPPASGYGVPPSSPRNAWSDTGAVADFALGYAPIPGVGIGVIASSHFFASIDSEDGEDYGYSSYMYYGSRSVKIRGLGALVVLRPDPRGGLSSGVSLSLVDSATNGVEASGYAVSPELGYDTWIGQSVSLGVLLRVLFARSTRPRSATKAACTAICGSHRPTR